MNELFNFRDSDRISNKPVNLMVRLGRDFSNQVPMYFPVCSIFKNDTIDSGKILNSCISYDKFFYNDGVEYDHTMAYLDSGDIHTAFNPRTIRDLGFEGDVFMHDPLTDLDRADITADADGCFFFELKSNLSDQDFGICHVKVYLSVIRTTGDGEDNKIVRDDIPLYYYITPDMDYHDGHENTITNITSALCGIKLNNSESDSSYSILGRDFNRSYIYCRDEESQGISMDGYIDFEKSSEDKYLGLKLCRYRYIKADPSYSTIYPYTKIYPVSYDEEIIEDYSDVINIDENWSYHDEYFNANKDYFDLKQDDGEPVFNSIFYETAYFLIHKVDSKKFDNVSPEDSDKYPEVVVMCSNYNSSFGEEDSLIDGVLLETQAR